ncbi:alpha/beta-hydrolase [Acaromyces ingoldii]|uniref:Alpha/beta-hydrolase n=1 Tax=Acaromyces ingoldii TaxID=215250 RepID=A0A316YH40_9BASI|nr:alpha/beta-hydrolase [Acaromyces ingoldii]PWN88860.1 alpha/beta-hydrolase [Acaromyces ingoldii]
MAPQLLECTLKQADGLDIKADVLLPPGATKESPAPVLLWWHGGGLLQGTRKGTAPHLVEAPEKHGLCVVSADYRLAPQARLPKILSDVGDAVAWLQTAAFREATQGRADASRVFVSGSSAGGWLALLAGSGLGFAACGLPPPQPRPQGVIGLYPISDLDDSFWTTKQHPVTYMKGRIIDGPSELGAYLDANAPVAASSALDSPRSLFYHYMIQEALLPSLLLEGTGISPSSFSVAQAVARGDITLPPTYMVHGSIDDKVPPRQATDVAKAMEQKGLPVEIDIEEGKDHLFDREPQEKLENMYAFIKRHC